MNTKKNKNGEFLGKTILLINTGSVKKKFILQKLRKIGLKIVVLNKEKNWAESYVDEWILADTNNHEKAIKEVGKFIKNSKFKIDGVVTFWEDDVLLTSKLVDKFGFIGIPFDISSGLRNKYLFRKFCDNKGIACPKYKEVKSSKDINYVIDNFLFPVVIKPNYGASSAFVIKIDTREELKDSYNYVKKNISKEIESALNDGIGIMVEEYIDGSEVDVDIVIQNGIIKFYSISDNNATKEPFFIETGRLTPSNLSDKDQNIIVDMVEEVLERAGVQNGCIHFEAKILSGLAIPIEVNLRMGGDEIYSSVKKVWKVDLIEEALKVALGVYIPKVKLEEPKKCILSKDFLSEYSGALVRLDIKPELQELDFVEDVKFFKKVGDDVLVPPLGYEYLGWITVSGDNFSEAQENLEEAIELIDYEVARFHSTSFVGKTLRRDRFSASVLKMSTSDFGKNKKIEKIRSMSLGDQRKLHIGIACNFYEESAKGVEVENELTSVGKNIEETLLKLGYKVTFFDFNNIQKVFNELSHSDVDMVFNVCERINNSSLLEPHAASILDVLKIPYTGSNPFTLGLCIDKIRVKKLLSYHNIPTPEWDYIYSLDDKIRNDLKYPLIVKPANADNSIGITNDSVVTDKKQLSRQLEKVIKQMKRPALIEEYIEGDEYDVSIIGNEDETLRVLPLSRSIFNKMPEGYWHIYPFEAKWDSASIYKKGITVQRPAKGISKKLEAIISEIALDTYNILDCHDYGRVEIRVDKNNNPYVLELNPNPSINIPDCVPQVATFIGMDYGDFLEEIIGMAIKRYKNRPPYYHLQASLI